MTARDLIQKILLATTEKEVKEYGGDPLDTEVMIKWMPMKNDVQVKTFFNKPFIVLSEEE